MAEIENVDDPIVTDDDIQQGSWRDALAGDDPDRLASLKDYETPDKFLEEFNALKNKNWRDDFAGDDPKLKQTFERFKSPKDLANSYVEAQQKIRSGQMKMEAPAADADEATIKAYREQNGIPLEADGYLKNLPGGLVVGDDDKEIFSDFMSKLHTVNAPPTVAAAAVEWYNNFKQEQQDFMAESDLEDRKSSEDVLRQNWGTDYRANVNLVGALLEKTWGAEAKQFLMNARGPDGRGIMNNAEIMEGFAQLARSRNPIGRIVSPTGNPEQTLNDEIAALEKYMATERTKYNNDTKAQDRLLELYDIRLKHNAA